jgi:hypothetical protein
MIIETCPKCGHDLIDLILASNPPIPKKECHNCGWSWTGKREEVVRVPFLDGFMGNYGYENDFLAMGYSKEDSKTLADLAVNSAISYNGKLDIAEAVDSLIRVMNNVDVEKLEDLK